MKLIRPIMLTLCCVLITLANTYGIEIKKIGVKSGLSNINVISITQDRDGFMWIGTKDGLNRFDANTFKVFRTSDSDSNSICSNALNVVYADKFDDVVWIASEKNGVDAYNYKTHVFTHYDHDYENPSKNDLSANGITFIDGDEEGNLWFATYDAGIDRLDKNTKRFTNYNQANVSGLGSNYNWTVLYDSDERIYVGHVNDGFSIINTRTMSAVNYRHDPNDPSSLTDNTVTSFLKDSKGRIWIGTRNGLNLFNPDNNRMINFKNDPENEHSLSNNFIQKMVETPDHKLYVGTEGGGMNILDLKDLAFFGDLSDVRFERILASETPDGLSGLSVQSVFQDSFGNIWIGGYGTGLSFLPARENDFHKIIYLPYIGNTNSLNNKSVNSICTDPEDQVWLASGSGGIGIYKDSKKLRQINSINNTSASQNIMSLYKTHDNDIYIGSSTGDLYFYNYNQDKFTAINAFNDLKNIPIYSFFEDSKHNLWFATDIGLYMYNPISQKSIVYTKENSGLSDNVIRAIAEDGDQNIWVGTLIGGLCVFDEDFKLIRNYGQSYDFYAVNHIYKDSRDRMWIASQNDLFLINNTPADSIMRLGKISGLAEADIKSIVEGKSENEIWVSTINGISQIDMNTMHVSNFDANDGIVSGDYLPGSVTKTKDGKIYFGSQNGSTWFSQYIEQSTPANPSATLSSFSITNNRNYLNQFTEIPFGNEIELKHNQSSFQIEFNVLDYSLSDKVEFIYQMKGLGDGWFLVNTEKEVTFRNLKPGYYTFNLKTRIQNNEWPEEVTSLSIRIKPPIWLTWWMKLIYFALITTAIVYALRFYTNKIKIENDLLFEKNSRQQEKDLNEEKLRFFTNITHELRSPMTLILGPLEDLLSDDSITPGQAKKLQIIQRVSTRLLQAVNQILEFRKSENKSRKLSVIKDDLAKYIYEIGEKYKDLNQNKAIEVKIEVPDQKIEMFFDPDIITIIMDNLLTNALKYTSEGRVELVLKQVQEGQLDYTEISVSDTGYGISDEDLPNIFDRYYQAKNAAHHIKGTGIGLALVKNMVELHEAEIDVSSTLNEGTTFSVKFLTNNSYPDAIHYFPEEPEEEQTEENTKNVILVVDDDAEIIEYIKDSLSDTYTIISAVNGKVGFDTACEEIPDIVISDIMMPIMDGIEMCKLMKTDVRTSHIPVVLLTAKGSLHDQKLGYDAGADSYLTKPFSSNLLKSRLKNIIDARSKYSLSTSSKFKQKQEILNESIGELDREFLKKLTSVIEENLEDEELNISYVAAQLNMSHSTLYRKIKALTSLTANEFIRKVRINFAEQLMLTNQYNISEIMYQVGINSSSYFRQCFKDEFGMNPSEYLQKLKES
ncbi:two-component regulator propeller domain-containing protein [Draconibacterium sp. IB214405]|uniref:hybrid sensor histidine kinase/response regulator transcription factor n=1 Tax=Draconibacterium sp. IB214405 TaxID=3097352 RepID=UPI002A17961D|nr:two-component regulator propeller domain-containing protein [Draconibacterium sp. IB214405]MDX8337555.1 two-component regulator propeller domain-containing protein [Draconibacterium sp. IB214405]